MIEYVFGPTPEKAIEAFKKIEKKHKDIIQFIQMIHVQGRQKDEWMVIYDKFIAEGR